MSQLEPGTDPVVDAGVIDDPRTSVMVLMGFWPAATMAVGRALLVADPNRILVRHDLAGVRDGIVHRVVRDGAGVLEDARVSLVHGCVSCTLREDVLPCLARLAATHPGRDLVLVLPEAIEPEAVADAAALCLVNGRPVTHTVRFDSFAAVADAEHVVADLASTDELADRAMHAAPDDGRGVAVVVARQIEYADTVLLWGNPEADRFESERCAVLLHRLAPWARHLRAGDEASLDVTELTARLRGRRTRPDAPGVLARGLVGQLLGVDEPEPDCGVVATVFRARRPFHPQRLVDALETLTTDVLRSRGHLWLASQPDLVLGWESAGGSLGMGGLGPWLAALPDERWGEVGDDRRAVAMVAWDPYYGDRNTHLAFIGIGLDAASVQEQLAGCLLTDAEISLGEDNWRHLPDPLSGRFDETTEETTGQPVVEETSRT